MDFRCISISLRLGRSARNRINVAIVWRSRMEITEDNLEWATVDRMSRMLTSVQGDYKVTQAYALFTAILCWVMQRIRADDIQMFDELRLERALGHPWNFRADGERPHLSNIVIATRGWNIGDLTTADLLVGLRDAAAHGDGRRIRPANSEGLLVGQMFGVRTRNAQMEVTLRRGDMAYVGELLASRFCQALARHQAQPDFVNNSAKVLEDGARV